MGWPFADGQTMPGLEAVSGRYEEFVREPSGRHVAFQLHIVEENMASAGIGVLIGEGVADGKKAKPGAQHDGRPDAPGCRLPASVPCPSRLLQQMPPVFVCSGIDERLVGEEVDKQSRFALIEQM